MTGGQDPGSPGALVDLERAEVRLLPALPADGPDPGGTVAVVVGERLWVAGTDNGHAAPKLVAASLALDEDKWSIGATALAPGLRLVPWSPPAAALVNDHIVLSAPGWSTVFGYDIDGDVWRDLGQEGEPRGKAAWARLPDALFVWSGETAATDEAPPALLSDGFVLVEAGRRGLE